MPSLPPFDLANVFARRLERLREVQPCGVSFEAWRGADSRFIHKLHTKYLIDDRGLQAINEYLRQRDLTQTRSRNTATWTADAGKRSTRPLARSETLTQFCGHLTSWRYRVRT